VSSYFTVEDVNGIYRSVWVIHESWDPERSDFGDLLPEEQRISNPFQLKR
jgi:hypothetical protein